ncbi:MAG: peptide ABC transporter substrate-binding protein [Erysipelotrichales bacterium]|nr:peptide ABC transporter substrate-binding protein [Erysipelotrichales bacterium]
MKKLAKLLLVLGMVLSMAACSNDSGKDQGGDGVQTTFTYAIGGEPEYLDPAVGSDSVTSYVTNQIYYPLFRIGPNGATVNEACVSYEESTNADGKPVYTFKLTEENYWSDGEKVTAHHYVYGMLRSLGMGGADSYYSYFIADYVLNAKAHSIAMSDVADMTDVGIKALDDYTIEITLESSTPYFVNLMTAGVFYPAREDYMPEHDMTWADDPTVPTNGPFQTTKIDRASEVVMVKNEYFPKADEVSVETMTAKIMADMDAQLMAFQTGEIDFATSLNSNVTQIYAGKEELLIDDSVINYFVLLNSYNDEVPALQDARVRRALALGIDRSVIVTALDAGDAYYELHGLVPNGFDGIDGDFRAEADAEEKLVYTDKEEAKRLLAEAGYDASNPLKITYYYNQSAMHDTVAEVLKAQWAEIGVEATLKTGEIRTFFDDRDNALFEAARHAMSADYMDPTTYLDMPTSWSQVQQSWGDETYDQMILDSRLASGDDRIQQLHDAEAYLIAEQSYAIPLFGYKSISLAKAGTTGAETNPQGNYYYWYVKVPA